jgi:hypothetical protein
LQLVSFDLIRVRQSLYMWCDDCKLSKCIPIVQALQTDLWWSEILYITAISQTAWQGKGFQLLDISLTKHIPLWEKQYWSVMSTGNINVYFCISSREFWLRIFPIHNIHTYIMFSYYVIWKGRGLFPNCSHKLLLNGS